VEFSIIIATYGRVESLQRLLESIQMHFGSFGIEHEVIVANNASDEVVEGKINALIRGLNGNQKTPIQVVREPIVGKCRAQNTAIHWARGRVLAFFDDDVAVTPGWLIAAAEFFRSKPYDVMQGPILVPPEMVGNEEFLKAQRCFRTIHFLQYRRDLEELNTLTGANMAVRREVFQRIGGFNEELGPGQSGTSEDVEFAQRVVRSGGRIGYEPRAGVYHCVDWNRLTEEYFRQKHEQQGRSRLLFKKQSLASIVPNILRSIWTLGWYSALGNERKKYRAKGRYFHYRAMLQEKIKGLPKVRVKAIGTPLKARHESHE
jgi:glycosyltransferase involved in cell wall biosynthesis